MTTKLRDRSAGRDAGLRQSTPARPVVLGTLSVRFDPSAERMAFDSALEAGVSLILANVMRMPPYPTTMRLVGPSAATLPHEEDLDAVRATAQRAASLGIRTEHLRITSKRPVRALLEVTHERQAGLLVFGPHLELIKPRQFRAAAKAVRQGATCLVWVAPDG